MKNSTKFKYTFIILFPIVISIILLAVSYKVLTSGIKLYKKAEPYVKAYVQGSPLGLAEDDDLYISENQYKIDILHYDLTFDLHPETKSFDASAIISAILIEPVQQLDLNFYDNFNISLVTINDEKVSFTISGKRLTLIPSRPFTKDTITIRVDYDGKPVSSGFAGFSFGEINHKSLVYTLNEPTSASSWFPCNDFPSDKAQLDMHITNDSSEVSVSNGKLMSIQQGGDRKTYNWKTFYPISSYLISLYSAAYAEFSDNYISLDRKDTMQISYFVLPDKLEDAEYDFKFHKNMLQVFSKIFGEYPFLKEKYGVAEFLWYMGAMENQTITGVPPNLISGKGFNKDILIHELAHHWWGDAVGLKHWKDIWLNEGFATYSEALYSEAEAGEKALISTMLSKKRISYPGTLANPGRFLFTSTVYNKGAWLLHMLRYEIGDSAFFNSLKNYYETFKYSNTSTEDFIQICENESHKKLDNFFNQWLNRNDYINLEYSWIVDPKKTGKLISLNVTQQQNGDSIYSFPLEVEVRFDSTSFKRYKFSIDQKSSAFQIVEGRSPTEIILDPDSWLLANIHETVRTE
jgi:aminopeptidase N